ncbi:unnamed protein product, partial [Onchocerca ochengi]|uniref:Ovule protein n=1 Tax=Onchocerca ochengi TaxID=42157 RepID=A0A182F0A4_ONCOC
MALKRKTYTQCLVHPTARQLSLPKAVHWCTHSMSMLHSSKQNVIVFENFENRMKTFRPTIPLIIRFIEYNCFITCSSYPEGNFRGN